MRLCSHWDAANWTRIHVSTISLVERAWGWISTSNDPPDLLASDSPPNSRFPRNVDLLRPAGRIRSLNYEMPWCLRQFPQGSWFDTLNCLTEAFNPTIAGEVYGLTFDLIFGVSITKTPRKLKGTLWDNERQMEYRLRVLAQLLWPLAWRENVSALRDKLEAQRYAALLSPSGSSYRPLITLRRAVADTRAAIVNVKGSIASLTEETIRAIQTDPKMTLSGVYESLLTEIDNINGELNDDIQLIIGAVTIQDSEAMKLQAERATLLTLLAAIYLPLTLVTGIFGMNTQEINGASPSFKACVQALVVVAVATGIFVLSHSRLRHWRKTQEQRRREKEVAERKDLETLFERASSSGTHKGNSTSTMGKAVEVIKKGWEAPKAAVSKVVKRKRRASPGTSLELGRRR